MKRRFVHLTAEKYVLNPPVKLLLALGVAPPGRALLDTFGAKTGKPRKARAMSQAARNRIAVAQRARWAKVRTQEKKAA